MDKRVTVVVVNWNLKEGTLRCLESLANLDYPHNTLLVDNGSSDGTIQAVQQQFPTVVILAQSSNLGFGKACNQAITHALNQVGLDYVFLLNNDAIVPPTALTELIQVANTHPQAGLLAPKIYYDQGVNKLWYAGASRYPGTLVPYRTGRGQFDCGQFQALHEVDYVFGTAMLIRRELIERIGMFDERFFLYMEDMDLCLRAQQASFKLLFVPQAHVYHTGYASTHYNPALRYYHYLRSSVIFLAKHLSPLRLAGSLPLWGAVALRKLLESRQ